MPRAAARAMQAPARGDPALDQFVARWNLRDEAQALLASMSPHARQKVIYEFAPRDTSRDANAIFIKFANGILQSAPRHTEAESFLQLWRLGPEAEQTFYGLLPEQQQRVMMEFSPRDSSSDANS